MAHLGERGAPDAEPPAAGPPARGAGAIQATRFEPTPETPRRGRAWLTPWRAGALLAGAALAWFLWFLFTAKSVRFDVAPATAALTVSGGFELQFSGIRLLREGRYQVSASAAGYQPLLAEVDVAAPRNQAFAFALTPLPGRVTFQSTPTGATVRVDGEAIGVAPFTADVAAGARQVEMTLDMHQPVRVTAAVTGREVRQTIAHTLRPDWALVTLPSDPPGAEIHVDDVAVGMAPGPVRVPSGERRIEVRLAGHKTWRDVLHVVAEQTLTLPPVTLAPADGLVTVASSPAGAGVTVNGVYRGLTPAQIEVAPGRSHQIGVSLAGHVPVSRSVRAESGREAFLRVELAPLTGELAVTVAPADAELWIDGELVGSGSRTLALSAQPHEVELRKAGYAGYRRTVTPQPGFTQELKVRLLTLEEARFARLTPTVTTAAGQELLLLKPSPIRLGASRREPGRRANEALRDVALDTFFYLSVREVTNAEFREFAAGHASGEFETLDLDKDTQPVANVAWLEAALYCNWLSERDGLAPFYTVEFGKVTGFVSGSVGYRLPTEAEWAWAARHVEDAAPLLRFPWGERLPPPDRHGNYADASARHVVGRIVFGYNDNHIVSAPVGTFDANAKGLHDLGGNVAEWVHDYYDIPEPDEPANPLGPPAGDYHVIKGSSWMHGAISELRLAFRDYGAEARPDVGFRIARFAEAG